MQLKFIPYFEAETSRVKSIAFHRHKPVILLGFHSGLVQAWDYLLCKPVLNFVSHEGPVRSVIFHPNADIFATGGDDCKIRLWNYHTRKVMHVFKGHKDYIRDLDFHPNKPWLLSASDDQTIKIWDIQSYKLIATLSGHTNYVMSAKFFNVDYVVSGSLDETIRIWNCSALNKINKSKIPNILSINDVVSELTLDAHEKGINNITVFNDTFLSASDDKTVKMWEYYRGTVIHKETMSNHYKNVTYTYFNEDIIISVGEDGNIFIYDRETKSYTKHSVEERYWCIKNYKNLYVVGSDTGFEIFKLEENIPVFDFYKNILYYAKNNKLIKNDMKKEEEIININNSIESIQVLGNMILVQYNKVYEIYSNNQQILKDDGKALLLENSIIIKKGDKIIIKDLSGKEKGVLNNVSGRIVSGRNISKENNYFFVIDSKKITAYKRNKIEDSKIAGFTYEIEDIIVFNNIIAIIGKKDISFTDNNLNVLYTINEMVDITSCIIENSIFIYSTLKHIKYVICYDRNTENDNYSNISFCKGILNSIDKEIYLISKEDNKLYYFSEGVVKRMHIDLIEIDYKLAVLSKDEDT
ncbi:Coatomer alpha subunit, partial [Spraguea lophii 42_110]